MTQAVTLSGPCVVCDSNLAFGLSGHRMHMLEAFAQKPKPVSAPEQFPSLVEDKRWYAKDTALFGLCNDLRVLTKAFAGSHQIFEIGAVCSRSNEDISN